MDKFTFHVLEDLSIPWMTFENKIISHTMKWRKDVGGTYADCVRNLRVFYSISYTAIHDFYFINDLFCGQPILHYINTFCISITYKFQMNYTTYQSNPISLIFFSWSFPSIYIAYFDKLQLPLGPHSFTLRLISSFSMSFLILNGYFWNDVTSLGECY